MTRARQSTLTTSGGLRLRDPSSGQESMKIAVIGSGYVGLVSAACFADWGHHVVSVDADRAKIADLQNGRMPIYEPGLAELVGANVEAGRLRFDTDLASAVADSDIVFITVGTPPRPRDGEADLSFVYQVAKDVALAVRGYTVIVTKSTVPVGTGDEVERIIARTRPDAAFTVVSNPEFLREGTAIDDFKYPDRVVIGTENAAARQMLASVYGHVDPERSAIVFTARRTAELIKYAANAFLAMRVSFINEIADLCEKVGADVKDVSLGMGLDRRIGNSFLSAGPGYGGSCFPKDTLALLRTAQDNGVPLRLVEDTVVVNEARKRRMALRVADALDGDVFGKTIAVLGLTFKANTDDMRDTPSVPLIESLQRAGARVRAYDPEGMPRARELLSDVDFRDDAYDCAAGADAVVLVTDWPSLTRLDLARLGRGMRSRVLVDLRNAYAPEEAERHGFALHAVGRPTRHAAGPIHVVHIEEGPALDAVRADEFGHMGHDLIRRADARHNRR